MQFKYKKDIVTLRQYMRSCKGFISFLLISFIFHLFALLGNQETRTAGGYSASHTVHEDFVLQIPDGMDLEKTAPILCAGITMFSPLMHWGAGTGEKKTVGIVGIGENMF
jgi:NADPH:quinone reductase-like Zn-dependent oxidoreductase